MEVPSLLDRWTSHRNMILVPTVHHHSLGDTVRSADVMQLPAPQAVRHDRGLVRTGA